MTEQEARLAVTEALKLGLTVFTKGKDGGTIQVCLNKAKYTKRKHFVIHEYALKQIFGEFVSNDANYIAGIAVDQAGSRIGKEAQKQIMRFLLDVPKLLS